MSHVSQVSPIERIDPRTRIVAVVLFSGFVAIVTRFPVSLFALLFALVLILLARLNLRDVLQRLLPINLFMLLLLVFLPWSTEGQALFQFGSWTYTSEGVWKAALIATKGNAILLTLVALLSTSDMTVLGHALSHLWVPDKLAHLLLFTVRYLELLRKEYFRLAFAMKVRGFRPRMNRHTYRSYGHLIGMLLVRGFDRSERVVAAMKCRGFQGHFYLLDHFHLSRVDAYFAIFLSSFLLFFAVLEWLY